jgi:porphobilinogen synthase
LKRAVEEAESLYALGVPAVILFGIPNQKDAAGEQAWDASGIVQRGLQQIGAAVPDLVLIADACFCEYTDHGHCGVLTADGRVDNDPTLANLQRAAVAQAAAGAHIIAPSGMMDGMVQAIRAGLDEAGYQHVAIMAYAAKYASAFYGPFRDAADSAPAFGDRRQYQMDPANSREALREVQLDLDEGADIVMVKPALAYLDIVRQVREQANVPVAASNVSGEYAMAKAAAQAGWVDEKALVLETMTAMRRAGADLILTYWARDIARWLSEGSASS